MDKDEALKLALIDRLINPEQHYEFTDPKKANAVLMSLCQEAADALAAQQEHEPENEPYVSLASVQEPVAYRSRLASGNYTYCNTPQFFDNAQPLYTTPPAAQPAPVQPVGIKGYAMALNEVSLQLRDRYKTDLLSTPLWAEFEKARNKFASSVATPPAAQRQWVGLTEAEKQWIRITEWTVDELIEWVNTKLKEKNT